MTAVYLLLLAVGIGGFTWFWSFSLGDPYTGTVAEGRIFSAWGARLLDRFYRRKAEIDVLKERHREASYKAAEKDWNATLANKGQPFPTTFAKFKAPPFEPVNWWKVTGVCPQCFNAWLSLAAFVTFLLLTGASAWWAPAFVPFLGVANMATLGIARWAGH